MAKCLFIVKENNDKYRQYEAHVKTGKVYGHGLNY